MVACDRYGMEMPDGDRIDIMRLSKKQLYDLRSHTLSSLAEHFEIDASRDPDKSISDCYAIAEIYERLKSAGG
jgi:DNA polymerase III epsilon subunit-like protein